MTILAAVAMLRAGKRPLSHNNKWSRGERRSMRRQRRRRLSGVLSAPEYDDKPADQRPGAADSPTGEDVGRVMDAEKDAAQPDKPRQQKGSRNDIGAGAAPLGEFRDDHREGE